MHQMTKDVTLLDSGAMENFVDKAVWRELCVGCFKLEKPLMVVNMDRTENRQGKIEHYCWLKVHFRERKTRMHFFLTRLGKDQFILEYPFLFMFNPNMDWRQARLIGGKVQLEIIRFQ